VASLDMTDEERQHLLDLLKGLPEPGAPAHAPVSSPLDRYAQLPTTTRAFFEELRQEDLDDLRKILKGWRSTNTVFWFFKWFLITLGGFFVGTIAFGEKLLTAISWFKGGPH
jgi:hypothetical protein